MHVLQFTDHFLGMNVQGSAQSKKRRQAGLSKPALQQRNEGAIQPAQFREFFLRNLFFFPNRSQELSECLVDFQRRAILG